MGKSCADCKWYTVIETKSGDPFILCVNDVDADSYLFAGDCNGFEQRDSTDKED